MLVPGKGKRSASNGRGPVPMGKKQIQCPPTEHRGDERGDRRKQFFKARERQYIRSERRPNKPGCTKRETGNVLQHEGQHNDLLLLWGPKSRADGPVGSEQESLLATRFKNRRALGRSKNEETGQAPRLTI